MARRILLIGATGLVGGLTADRLLALGREVHGLDRRPTGRGRRGWRERRPAAGLSGVRAKDRRRRRGLKERLAILVSPAVNLFRRGRIDNYAAIDAAIVADAVAALSGAGAPGRFVHHNRDLHRLARG